MKHRFKFALTAFLALPLLGGCGGGTADDLLGHVRLVNATTEYAGLDLAAGASAVSANVASYAAGSFATLDPGTISFNLKATGSSATSATTSQSATKNAYNTIVAYTTGGTLTTAYLSDNEAAPSAGTAKLRVFNTASTDAGKVDIYVIDTECASLATSAAAAITTGVEGLQTSYAQVSAAAAGSTYHLCVTAAGDKTDLRLDVPALTLTDQQIATLILARGAGGVLLNGLVLNQRGALSVARNTSVRMRVAASAVASGSVTASANGVSLGIGFVSPAVGPYRLVAAGPLALSVTINNAPVTAPASLAGMAGADLTLLVAGSAAAPAISLIGDDNTVSASSVKPVKLRLVNGLNGVAGPVTLTVDNSQVGEAAAFGTTSAAGIVAASAALAQLDAVQAGNDLARLADVTLTSGSVYTFFLLGDMAAPKSILRVDR